MPDSSSPSGFDARQIAGFAELDAFTRRIATMSVCDPATGQPLRTTGGEPITIDVRNQYSEHYEIARYQLRRDWQSRWPGCGGFEPTPDDQMDHAAFMAAAATAAWSGIVLDGVAVELTHAVAAKLYRRFPWLREQVSTACHDLSRFGDPSLRLELPREREDGV